MDNLKPQDIRSAIVYILHYGRPLFKGEGEPEEGFISALPSIYMIEIQYEAVSEPTTPSMTTTTTTAPATHHTTAPPSTAATTTPVAATPNIKQANDDDSFPSLSMEDLEPAREEKGKEKNNGSGSWDSCESITEEELPRMYLSCT